MERLTKRNADGVVTLAKGCHDGCKYLTCSMEEGYSCEHQCEADIVCKLAAYEDKEEQGLIRILPCKIGSTVYVITECDNISPVLDGTLYGTATGYYCPYELNGKCPHDCEDCEDAGEVKAVFEDTVAYIMCDEVGNMIFTEKTGISGYLGVDVFATEAEAESALAKIGGK